MKFRVVDLETVGTDKDKQQGKPAGICEIGWTDVTKDLQVLRPVSHLVSPAIPMPDDSRGIHHISDEMLASAMDPTTATRTLMDGMEPGDVFAAHRAAFERVFFGGGSFPWICTMICAQHLCEDAPSFSNQTLRYFLGIDREFEWPELAMPPHRAGPDSYVTAHILSRLLVSRSPGQLITLTTSPVLQKTVRFGKHEGRLWSEMDEGYLQWVLDRGFNDETKHTVRHHLQRIRRTGNPFGN